MSDGTKIWFDFFNAYSRAPKELLPHASRTVLGSLLSFANGPNRAPVLGSARPGVDRLVTILGMSESTVRKALSDLRTTGWITPTSGARGGTHHATTYQLQVPDNVRAFLDVREAEMKVRRDANSDRDDQTPPENRTPGVRKIGGEGSEKLDPTYSPPTHEPSQVSATGKADALTLRKRIGEDQWKIMLTSVQHAAADQWDAETHDHLEGAIRMFCGDDIADYHVCYHHTPPAKATERYQAGKWLKTMISTALSEGMELGVQNAHTTGAPLTA